jgi:hypothetical protein
LFWLGNFRSQGHLNICFPVTGLIQIFPPLEYFEISGLYVSHQSISLAETDSPPSA